MIELLQALLTPAIALVTTYIAYEQYRIRRDERALALYDRRLAVFKSAIAIVDRIRAGNAITTDESFAWLTSVQEAEFLFGEEVQTVIDPLFGAVHEYAIASEPASNGRPFDMACADAALNVERFRSPFCVLPVRFRAASAASP